MVMKSDSGMTVKMVLVMKEEGQVDMDTKKQIMTDLLERVNQPTHEFQESEIPIYIKLMNHHVFRTLPLPPATYDPDEDRPSLNPSWPFLELVYELMFHLIDAPIPPKVIKQYITPTFCTQLVATVQSQDPRERGMVATALYKIYAKFKSLRLHIRQEFIHVFMEYSEYAPSGYPYGLAELLEVLSSIIKGFVTPLQVDHIQLLTKTLLPLFKHSFMYYHQPLLLCMTNYIEKDPNLATPIIEFLLRYWPKQSTAKQILYLNALEEVLENTPVDYLKQDTKIKVTELLAKCLSSIHFQVAERTLFLWNSTQLINHSIFNPSHTRHILPILFPSLMVAFKEHWNVTVRMLAHSVLEMYTKHDNLTYQACLRAYKNSAP